MSKEEISYFERPSPSRRNAINVAKRGDVLLMKDSLEKEISRTAVLKIKKVKTPLRDRAITSLHIVLGIFFKFTLSLYEMKDDKSRMENERTNIMSKAVILGFMT